MRYAVICSSDWRKPHKEPQQLWFGWAATAGNSAFPLLLLPGKVALLFSSWRQQNLASQSCAGADEPYIIHALSSCKQAGTHFCWTWTLQNVLVQISFWERVTMVTSRSHGPVVTVSACEHRDTEKVNQVKAAVGWIYCLWHQPGNGSDGNSHDPQNRLSAQERDYVDMSRTKMVPTGACLYYKDQSVIRLCDHVRWMNAV